MSVDGPTGAGRVHARLRIVLVLAAVLATIAGTYAKDSSPLPLTLRRCSDGTPATVAAGPAAFHVAFFATWCSTCTAELPALAELESRWAARGYRLVLVAVPTRQSCERVATFVSESHPPGEVLFDATGAALRAFAVDHLPTHVLLDRYGNVVHRSGSIAEGVGPAVERLLAVGSGGKDPRR